MPNLWDRQDGETPKAFAAFCLYRDLPAIDRSVLAAREGHQKDTKGTLRQWKGWSMRNDWVNRAAEHDSDLASRRRIRRGDALERAQDDIANMSRAALAKLLPLLQPTDAGGLDPYQIPLSQIPSWLRTLADLQLKSLGYEDSIALTGKDGGPVKVDTKTQHVFQPSKEVWDDILRIRAQNATMFASESLLPDSECRSIAKSCFRYWTRQYDPGRFSDIQRSRMGQRWHGNFGFDFNRQAADVRELKGWGLKQATIRW